MRLYLGDTSFVQEKRRNGERVRVKRIVGGYVEIDETWLCDWLVRAACNKSMMSRQMRGALMFYAKDIKPPQELPERGPK